MSQDLLNLLASAPSADAFAAAWNLLASFTHTPCVDVQREIDSRLEAWPDDACQAPEGWWRYVAHTPVHILLRVVHLGGPFMTAAPLEAYQALPLVAPYLRTLTVTRFEDGQAADCVAALGQARFERLRRLNMVYAPESLPWLQAASLPALEHLEFEADLAPRAWARLLQAPWAARLETMALAGDSLVGHLGSLSQCTRLKSLKLSAWGDEGCAALGLGDINAVAQCPQLTALDIRGTRLDANTAQAITGSRLPGRLEQLRIEVEAQDVSLLGDDLKLSLWEAGWVHPQPRRAIESAYHRFFQAHKHKLRAEAVAQSLQQPPPHDFGHVLRQVAWVRANARAPIFERLSLIDSWEPGPLACMKVGPFNDTASDMLSGLSKVSTAVLFEFLGQCDPCLKPWLQQATALLDTGLLGDGAAPPEFERWRTSKPSKHHAPTKIVRALAALMRQCVIRDYYIEWRRQERFVKVAEAFVVWRASEEDFGIEQVRRRFERTLAMRLLMAVGDDRALDDQPPGRCVH